MKAKILTLLVNICGWLQPPLKIKAKCQFQKWTINDLMIASVFTSLILGLQYLTLFLPKLPFGGSFEFKYLIIFLVTYLTTFQKGVVIAIISTVVSLVMLPKIIINFWQYGLDYFIPALAPTLIGFIKLDFKNQILVKVKIFWITTIAFSFIYCSHVISGYLYFSMYAWNGFSSWAYALVYNGFTILMINYPLTLLLLLIILKKTKSIRKGVSC